jgi:hypothetical protein
MPQYSWQNIAYSPGFSKRAVTREICPGRSITFTWARWDQQAVHDVLAGRDERHRGAGRQPDLARREGPDLRGHDDLVLAGSRLLDAGRVERRVLRDLSGRHAPSTLGRWMPAPNAVTAKAASIPTGIAIDGRIQASS